MSEKRRLYLDANATTPVDEEVFEAMTPYLKNNFGNPSSGHWFGRTVKNRIEEARESVAALINADPAEIAFCSGGTESDNMALQGIMRLMDAGQGWKIITSAVEHPAVLATGKYLSKNGYERELINVDSHGVIDMEHLNELVDEKTAVVSVMHANNEVGTIQPVKEAANVTKAHGAVFHCDAVQSVGKIKVDVQDLGVDLLSLSGHKIYGPKGIGALYIRKGIKLAPLNIGGHHERGKRAGTENVAGIIGLGKACELAAKRIDEDAAYLKPLRDALEERILKEIPYVRQNSPVGKRLPSTLNMTMECVEGETLLIQCDMAGIAISTGSACSSGSLEPSHVLSAMGIPPELIHGSLRFSFSRHNTMDDVDYVMKYLPKIVQVARDISPLWDGSKPIPFDEVCFD